MQSVNTILRKIENKDMVDSYNFLLNILLKQKLLLKSEEQHEVNILIDSFKAIKKITINDFKDSNLIENYILTKKEQVHKLISSLYKDVWANMLIKVLKEK